MKLHEFQEFTRDEAFKLVNAEGIILSMKITPLDKLSRMLYDMMVTECEPLRKG